ncbi:helix-turn-helix transcriptional regulator [Phaeobacter sp. JH20_12]|uniref:helix-turn-helix domain-containing protein n=2 Tax=unclassified Phaeobacter TaxID=2621772 RepID=UPI003A841B86
MNTMVMITGGMTSNSPEQQKTSAFAGEMRPERIGYRLSLLRRALGLQPSEIADLLGIERTYWSRTEGGKRAASKELAALLVDRFGVTMDFVILGQWGGLPLELATKMRAIESQEEPK